MTATTARDKMTAKIQARTTDQLFADLVHLETLPKTPETRLVGAAIADVITEREGIDEQLDAIFGDVDFAGTYLEAMLIAVTAKKIRPIWTPEDYAQTVRDAAKHRTYPAAR